MIGGRQASDSIRWRAKVCRRTGGSNTGRHPPARYCRAC